MVKTHLTCTNFDEVQLFLLEHFVPNKMVPSQELLCASVVHRVMRNVECWLAVHEHLNRLPPHLPLASGVEVVAER